MKLTIYRIYYPSQLHLQLMVTYRDALTINSINKIAEIPTGPCTSQ